MLVCCASELGSCSQRRRTCATDWRVALCAAAHEAQVLWGLGLLLRLLLILLLLWLLGRLCAATSTASSLGAVAVAVWLLAGSLGTSTLCQAPAGRSRGRARHAR